MSDQYGPGPIGSPTLVPGLELQADRKIPGKHGARPAIYREVVVAIPDAPGALGRLFVDVGDAGVNVEDISIEHDPVREVGYLAISVAPKQYKPLVATMLDHGWTVS